MKDIFKRHPRYRDEGEELPSVPDNLWIRCPRCRELIYSKEYEQALRVCSKCKHHGQLDARERIDITLDRGSFQEYDAGLGSTDPLSFKSLGDPYSEKLEEYEQRAGTKEAFIYGTGSIDAQELVFGATQFKFGGGSMGAAYGEKVSRAMDLSLSRMLPLVIFSTGGGARMQEGVISLLQMAKTVSSLDRLKDAGLPFISVMTDPCLGGTTASYAMLGDVNVAEPGAYIGFAGRRVIEQTMRQKLPANAATAEFLEQHGMIDVVVPRPEMAATLGRLLRLYATCNASFVERRNRVEQPA